MGDIKPTRARILVAAVVFITSVILFADRNILPVIAEPLMKSMNISASTLGWIFSCFSIVYVIGQIPGGWLLDRFGSRNVFTLALMGMACVNLMQGAITLFSGLWVLASFFLLRGMLGFAETPGIPACNRVIATWFPLKEKGLAGSVCGASQYMAVVAFVPFFAWFASKIHYQALFFFVGVLEIVVAILYYKCTPPPAMHPWVNKAEVDYIRNGGGLPDIDNRKGHQGKKAHFGMAEIKGFLSNRITIGIFLSQYCFNCLAFFFLSWFPMYLMSEKGMDIQSTGILVAIPAFGAFLGGISSGGFSDFLMRKSGSLTLARKVPIVIGMLCSCSMFFCNYTNSMYLIITFMTLAYFGKGCSTLGWIILTDIAPKEIIGTAGGIFNAFGNISTVITPIVIGYIVSYTGSFTWALIFVGAHAVLALFSYLFIVGSIQRIEIVEEESSLVIAKNRG